MNTAEALEAMTDRGKFELLATSVLRVADDDYKAIIHTGVNAKGEPIKSPLDGFCRVPRSKPPLFVIVQHTTAKDLKAKWLHDPKISRSKSTVDGDLVKAGYEANEIREEFPDAAFIVALTTNRRVDVRLQKKTHKKAQSLGVEVDIWDQSRLVHELDNTPEGQWLRREFLDIEAEQLSSSLLRYLCEQSLFDYARQTYFITEPQNWIARDIDGHIEAGILQGQYSIQLLIGGSGSGKSSCAYQALRRHLETGGYGIWMNADLIGECTNLENALTKVLRDYHPRLQADAGRIALLLTQEERKRFLLVIDDINRANEPARILRRLLAWSKPLQMGEKSQELSSPYFILCPIWPQNYGHVSQYGNSKSWVNTTFISPMNPQEGIQAVQIATGQAGMELTAVEAQELAGRMGNEPILIGLFNSQLTDKQRSDLNDLAENAVDRFINLGIDQAAASSSYLTTEYRRTLQIIGRCMLKNRRIYPSWTDIESWLVQERHGLDRMRGLVKHSGICQLNEQNELVFRHDRIRDALLVENVTGMIKSGVPELCILEEPFYAEIIGQAVARTQCKQEILEEIRERTPLVLFEAIKYLGETKSSHKKAIIQEAKQWVSHSVSGDGVPNSILWAISWSLAETDCPAVLDLTEKFPRNPLILIGRLRNGCARSGVSYCAAIGDLTRRDSRRDQIIEHAKRKYRGPLLAELKQMLVDPAATDEQRSGALIMTGCLGVHDLGDQIIACWELAENRTRILPEAIWASAKCCGNEPGELLDPLMEYWAGLSDEEGKHGRSPKRDVSDELRLAFRPGLDGSVIAYFTDQCDVYESLLSPIIYMLSEVDSPISTEFVVRSADNLWYSMSYVGKWDVNTGRPDARKLSEASMKKLRTLWESVENGDSLRLRAFCLWLTGIGIDEVEILRSIPSCSPLHRASILKRSELGDCHAVKDLIPILQTASDHFNVAHHVWCDELMSETDRYLESFKDNIPTDYTGGSLDAHYSLSELLMRTPREDAETLLAKHWTHLGFSSLFIQTALHVGTPKCLELAASSLEQCPPDIPIFKHIGQHFGFMNSMELEHLTEQYLNNLLPYLDRFDQHSLRELAEACRRLGVPEWSEQYISHRFDEDTRRYYHPSDNDLSAELSKFALEESGEFRVEYWLEQFDRRHDSKDHALKIIHNWLESHRTLQALRIASACIQIIGTRADLSILDKYEVEGKPDEIARIKENAWFSVYRRTLD